MRSHQDPDLCSLAESAARGDSLSDSETKHLGASWIDVASDLDTAERKLAQSDRREIDRLHALVVDLRTKLDAERAERERIGAAFLCATKMAGDLERQLHYAETDTDEPTMSASEHEDLMGMIA